MYVKRFMKNEIDSSKFSFFFSIWMLFSIRRFSIDNEYGMTHANIISIEMIYLFNGFHMPENILFIDSLGKIEYCEYGLLQ